ncbi:MAG: SAM-dependent methyltransferase, partial [Bacteroidota bacterium]
MRISEYKSLAKTLNLPDAHVIREEKSPYGLIQLVESDLLRYAPGLSLSYTEPIPRQLGIFKNGEWVGASVALTANRAKSLPIEYLQFTTSAAPYTLRPLPASADKVGTGWDSICIIGVGSGSEVLTALASNPKSITGIEVDPALLSITKEYLERALTLHGFPGELHLIPSEGRGFLTRSGGQFDLIVIPLLESFSSGATGIYGINEDYLFTVESFSLMLSRLKTNGFLAITEWIKVPERSVLRLIATLLEALEASGIKDPSQHLAAIRSWGTATVIVKQSPFQSNEIDRIRQFCSERSFDLIYVPGIREEETNRYHRLQEPLYYRAV